MTTTAVSHQPSWGYYATSNVSWGELGDPRAGPYGVNSGVLLVNLTRARQVRHQLQGARVHLHDGNAPLPSPHSSPLFFCTHGQANVSAAWEAILTHRPSHSSFYFFDQDLLNVYLRLNPEVRLRLWPSVTLIGPRLLRRAAC